MKASQLIWFAPVVAGSVLPRSSTCSKALYFLDNNPSGSSIVALEVSDKDGTLSNPVRTPTGGLGLFSLGAMGVNQRDQLFSQDAVVSAGKHLLAVNPGSNTLSLFTIPESDPLRPVLLGAPASTGGEYPSAVAFSPALHVACALNTGAKAGVQCFDVSDEGLKPAGGFMPIALPGQTTPPKGPPNTASDVLFNPSGTALFVTVKGDGTGAGFVYAYPVKDGKVAAAPVVSRPPELMLEFSMNFVSDSRAVITDPAYGASFVEVAYPSLHVAAAQKVVVAGQGATCWSVYAERFDAVYILDGGNPNITTLDPATGKVKYVIPGAAGTMGCFDSVVHGSNLYVMQATAGISVFDLAAGGKGSEKVPKLVQNLDLSVLGSRQGWQGLAIFPN